MNDSTLTHPVKKNGGYKPEDFQDNKCYCSEYDNKDKNICSICGGERDENSPYNRDKISKKNKRKR